MTPSERLKTHLPDAILAHELGHLILGLELGLNEGDIEFLENNPDEIARAYFSVIGATPPQRIIRGLAGMYCQALCFPDSIAEPLRTKILNEHLFTHEDCLTNNPPDIEAIKAHGFIGDWISCIDAAKSGVKNPQESLARLRQSHKELCSIAETINLAAIADKLLHDIKQWMLIDDPDLDFSPSIFYSLARARPIWQNSKA